MAHDPFVFISSTSDDLKEHREQAAKAALASGFSPRLMEYFPAAGHKPTLAECMEKVAEAEVMVVLVAHRYGWVSDGPENPDAKSVTWLECEHSWQVTAKLDSPIGFCSCLFCFEINPPKQFGQRIVR
jgi:hypothetical protein